MERLTAKRAETPRKPGRYRAGDTVYLVLARGRTGRVNKRWVQRFHVQGKRRDISIGTYPAVTLSEARAAPVGEGGRLEAVAADGLAVRERCGPRRTLSAGARAGGVAWRQIALALGARTG